YALRRLSKRPTPQFHRCSPSRARHPDVRLIPQRDPGTGSAGRGGTIWRGYERRTGQRRTGDADRGEDINKGSDGSFKQRLGLFDCSMLIAGTMIGSGIFIVSAEMARDVGSSGWLLVVWIISGIMTILGALSYAELAAMMPQAGGQYVFLRESYSPL